MSWKQGQDHFEGFMHFVEQSPHYNASEVMQFHIAYNNFLQKKANSCKQADIRELFARPLQRSAAAAAAISSLDEPSPTNLYQVKYWVYISRLRIRFISSGKRYPIIWHI